MAKKKGGKTPGPRWTAKIRKFVEGLQKGMNQTDAARFAGYADGMHSGAKLIKNQLVIRAMAEYEEMRRKAAQKALDEDARKPVITRRRIEQILAKIAEESKEDGVKVRAASVLADIKGMRIQRNLDLNREFEGKSEEELEFFAINGYFPDEHLDPGKPGTPGVASQGPPPPPTNQKL